MKILITINLTLSNPVPLTEQDTRQIKEQAKMEEIDQESWRSKHARSHADYN